MLSQLNPIFTKFELIKYYTARLTECKNELHRVQNGLNFKLVNTAAKMSERAPLYDSLARCNAMEQRLQQLIKKAEYLKNYKNCVYQDEIWNICSQYIYEAAD